MNKSIFLCLATFLIGGAVGSLVTAKLLEKKYAEIAEEEIESVKEAYNKYRQNTMQMMDKAAAIINEKKGPTLVSTVKSPGGVLSRGSADTVRANPYEQAKMDYAKISTSVGRDPKTGKFIKVEEPEGAPDEEEDDRVKDDAGKTEEDQPRVENPGPYIIDDQSYSDDFGHHDKLSLYYYKDDDVLCEENEDVIDDIEGTIGNDALGILDKNIMVWVRNERLGADYEIIGLKQSYAEAVHGILGGPENENSRRTNE